MGKNREHEKIAESDSDSTDNDSQESEPEQTQTTPAAAAKKPLSKSASKPTPAAAAKKPPLKSASKPETSSESGSSDSDSDGPGNPNPTPIPTQPQKSTKKSAADPVTPAAKKRPAAEEKESNKLKKKKAAEPESPGGTSIKKSIIQRKWSEGDELVILQGMIDNPTADGNAFLDLIKENLDRKDALKSNLQDKISKLKKKYENNWIKENDGKEMSFLKPHDHKVYDLSKLVWGRNKRTTEEAAAVKEGRNKRTTEEAAAVKEGKAETETESVWLARMKSSGVSFEERVLTIGAEMFENGKVDAAGAKEWKKLRIEEIQTFLRQLEVKTAQARLVVELLKK